MKQTQQQEAVKNIPLEQLQAFAHHPFQVREDEEFQRLVESIEVHGVIHPALARPIRDEDYLLPPKLGGSARVRNPEN